VQKKVDKFANRTKNSVWETLAQLRKIVRICALFKAYTGEQLWKSIGDRLKRPCYLSRDNHDCEFGARRQRAVIGKYCFVNRIIKLWNKLPAETLATFCCKSRIFRSVRKVIISEEK
jgi:hypothetical protein